MKMRIAIVNDVLIAVEVLRRILITVPEYEIAWVARTGIEAVTKCAADTPDLILMDVYMPQMGGVEATKQIMANSPCAIVMVTATVGGHAGKVFEAMGYGALDAVNTPILRFEKNPQDAAELLAKIATISKLLGKSRKNSARKSQLIPANKKTYLTKLIPPLVVIGASTGGPKALANILTKLPVNFAANIVIVQHIDGQFVASLVEWLNSQTVLTVELAEAGCSLQAGKVLVAGKNQHLILGTDLRLNYTPEPVDYPYCPSVNTFFNSVAAHYPKKGIGVLLTGMGRDGAEGLSLLRSAGWHTIAQDQKSSVIYGMPKAAVELGAAVEVLPIEAIASKLSDRCQYSHKY